jgi:D-alanyl-D-alanine-carboxypeptidase/D-alanyl-D-alanine-endopeptidase
LGWDAFAKRDEQFMRVTRRALCASGALAVSIPAFARALAALTEDAAGPPPEIQIHNLLAQCLDALAGPDDGIGIAVGLIGPHGRRFVSVGHFNQGDRRAVDASTVFEIGSVTKIFTALLLADFIRRGEVSLSDPAAKYLPTTIRIPQHAGKEITLFDLATHTSGLPFMPPLPDPSAAAAREYSRADLYGFLADFTLTQDIGTQWDYSNLGYWLLGEVLAARGGADYELLLMRRVVMPLGMRNTAFASSAPIKAKLATGHYASSRPADSMLSFPGYSLMAAAGGLLSTVDDLLAIPSIALEYRSSPFAALIANCLSSRRATPSRGVEQALGWTVIEDQLGRLIFRDGGTFGYASALIWDPLKRIGVVVLSNHVQSVSDIAHHLVRPDFPLDKPAVTRHTEVPVEFAALENYAGKYKNEDEGIFELRLDGNFLTFLAPSDWGLPALRLHAESALKFFANELPVLVSIQMANDGRVEGIVVTPPRGQHTVQAQKVP